MIDFKEKTALITGATRGIGKAISESLWDLGCNVIATGRGIEPSEGLAKSERFRYLQLDFLNKGIVSRFLNEISEYNNIDILVNNAGINFIQSIDQINEEKWSDLLQVNLTGPMLLASSVVKGMKQRRSGRILNISSIFGVISKEKRAAYSASKSGLIGLTKASALDLAEYNILVNALCPGFTETELTNKVLSPEDKNTIMGNIPLQRLADVNEIANVALFLCSDMNTYITGQAVIVDGGYTIA